MLSEMLKDIKKIKELAQLIEKDQDYIKSIEMMDAPTNAHEARIKIAANTEKLLKLAREIKITNAAIKSE